MLTFFTSYIFLTGNACKLRHCFNGHTADLTKLLDSGSNLAHFEVKTCHHFFFHTNSSLIGGLCRDIKKRPKENLILETSTFYPRYHSNCNGCYPDAPSDSIKPYALTQHSRKGSNHFSSFLPFNSGATAICSALVPFTSRHLSQKLSGCTLHHRH